MTTKPNPTNYVRVDESSNIKRVNEDNSTTPIVEVNPVEIADDQEVVAIENENIETSKTIVDTWYIVPTNAKGVEVQVNALGSGVKATVEYSLDRAGVTAGSTTSVEDWASGEITNEVQSASFNAIAGVRMKNITTNEVKSSYTTNLTGANNDMVYTSKLTGTAGDAISIEYVDPGASVAEVKSSYTTDLVGDNNDIVYTSKLTGVLGDAITVEYVDPSDTEQSLLVEVTGTDITVNLATDAGGIITSTADEIKAAIAALPAAHALVGTADKAANDGSGVVTAMAKTNLAGGVDADTKTLAVTVSDTDISVSLATDTGGNITSTAANIKTAIEGTPAAHALVGLANAGSDTGAGTVTALTKANLTGGVNPTLPKMFITVV